MAHCFCLRIGLLSLSKIHSYTKAHFHQLSQRWVTLQPDSDYNPREKCKEKRKLDLEAITKEIIEEISDNRRSNKDFNQGSRSKLFGDQIWSTNGPKNAKNNLVRLKVVFLDYKIPVSLVRKCGYCLLKKRVHFHLTLLSHCLQDICNCTYLKL